MKGEFTDKAINTMAFILSGIVFIMVAAYFISGVSGTLFGFDDNMSNTGIPIANATNDSAANEFQRTALTTVFSSGIFDLIIGFAVLLLLVVVGWNAFRKN